MHSLLSYAYGKSSEVGSVTRFYVIFLLLKRDCQQRVVNLIFSAHWGEFLLEFHFSWCA